jgi:hypothetical protein
MKSLMKAVHLVAAAAFICFAATAAHAQRSDVTLKVASFAGPFGDAMTVRRNETARRDCSWSGAGAVGAIDG